MAVVAAEGEVGQGSRRACNQHRGGGVSAAWQALMLCRSRVMTAASSACIAITISIQEISTLRSFNGSGLSSGDINRDGWPDVVAASGPLVILYMNEGGERFNAIEMDVTGIEDLAIFNVALVDINGDGWLDLFGTTYLQGNFVLLNYNGKYTSEGLRQLPRGQAVLSSSVAFGDVDRDGDLDAVIGNWFAGASKKHPPPAGKQ